MKTVIDLDTELVEAAAAVLGTKTKKDTIHAALSAAVDAARRQARAAPVAAGERRDARPRRSGDHVTGLAVREARLFLVDESALARVDRHQSVREALFEVTELRASRIS